MFEAIFENSHLKHKLKHSSSINLSRYGGLALTGLSGCVTGKLGRKRERDKIMGGGEKDEWVSRIKKRKRRMRRGKDTSK